MSKIKTIEQQERDQLCQTCIYSRIKPNIECKQPFDQKRCTWHSLVKWRFIGKLNSEKVKNICMYLFLYKNFKPTYKTLMKQLYRRLHPCIKEREAEKEAEKIE